MKTEKKNPTDDDRGCVVATVDVGISVSFISAAPWRQARATSGVSTLRKPPHHMGESDWRGVRASECLDGLARHTCGGIDKYKPSSRNCRVTCCYACSCDVLCT